MVYDGVRLLPPFIQTTGVAQGDNLSPLLFSVLLADFPALISSKHPLVKVLLYADDIVMYSHSRVHLQSSLRTLAEYVETSSLTVNTSKTQAMKFRKGGRLSTRDVLRLNGESIAFVSSFTYLGITLTPTTRSFTEHTKQRYQKGLLASLCIKSPSKLSLRTALQIFKMKVSPSCTYGIEVTWDDLTVSNLRDLERVKMAFLKRVLGLPRRTRNRFIYTLCDTPVFVTEIRKMFSLAETPSFKTFVEECKKKREEIQSEFYESPAMKDRAWMEANRVTRPLVTGFAVHGFHFKICSNTSYHDPGPSCLCKLCGSECELYHLERCISKISLSRVRNLL